MAALAAQVPNATLIDGVQGVEDPRTFVHSGRLHLLGTFHVLREDPAVPQPLRTLGRKRQVGWEGHLGDACGPRSHALALVYFHVSLPLPSLAPPQWNGPGAPLYNYMAALRLAPGLGSVERGVVLRCEALQNTVCLLHCAVLCCAARPAAPCHAAPHTTVRTAAAGASLLPPPPPLPPRPAAAPLPCSAAASASGRSCAAPPLCLPPHVPARVQRMKNFMPLQLASGELYMVTDVQPLTVVQPDLETGACRVVLREGSAPSSASAGGRGGAPAFDGAADVAAVVGGGHVHGGSPFVHLGGELYLR